MLEKKIKPIELEMKCKVQVQNQRCFPAGNPNNTNNSLLNKLQGLMMLEMLQKRNIMKNICNNNQRIFYFL